MSSAGSTFWSFTLHASWVGLCRHVLFVLVLSQPLCAQQIINGSFEINDLDCGINLPNSSFNTHVPHITAFGGQSEIDLLSNACDYNDALDGNYLLALYHYNFSDAFSFELTQTLQADKLYKLRFAAKLGAGIFNKNSKVQIGLTNAAGSFGKTQYVSPVLDTIWQYFQVQFHTTEAYEYISVSIVSIDQSWVFLDDFSLECPGIDLGRDTALCMIEHLVLDVGNYFETYQWSDLSAESSLSVEMPGVYWVRAQDGDCIASDTISITELPFNCDCSVYLPNVFSPNDDGVNDAFQPMSPCEILDYKLRVFDRWGQLVFTASQPNERWNGYFRGQLLVPGVYLYVLSYRFYYQQDVQQQTGNVTLLR